MNTATQSRHTPGPWKVDSETGQLESKTLVLGMIYGYDSNGTEGEANAKLIAAAPELLDALKDLLGDVMDLLNKNDSVKLGTMGTIHIVQAQRAIKKATE